MRKDTIIVTYLYELMDVCSTKLFYTFRAHIIV